MRSLTKPTPPYDYQAAVQVAALRNYRDSAPGRAIPPITPGTVLVATWNVANLGVHKRRQKDLGIIAEMISWYELIALQEIADNLDHLKAVVDRLPNHYDLVFSDKAGNAERSAYVYDTWRVTLGPKIGEIVIVESARDEITLPGISRRFRGFNRNPYNRHIPDRRNRSGSGQRPPVLREERHRYSAEGSDGEEAARSIRGGEMVRPTAPQQEPVL